MGQEHRLKRLLDTIKDKTAKKELLSKMTHYATETQRVRECSILHIAAANGNSELVRYLIHEQEMNVDMLTSKGDSPLTYACKGGHENCVTTLLKLGKTKYAVEDRSSYTSNILMQRNI